MLFKNYPLEQPEVSSDLARYTPSHIEKSPLKVCQTAWKIASMFLVCMWLCLWHFPYVGTFRNFTDSCDICVFYRSETPRIWSLRTCFVLSRPAWYNIEPKRKSLTSWMSTYWFVVIVVLDAVLSAWSNTNWNVSKVYGFDHLLFFRPAWLFIVFFHWKGKQFNQTRKIKKYWSWTRPRTRKLGTRRIWNPKCKNLRRWARQIVSSCHESNWSQQRSWPCSFPTHCQRCSWWTNVSRCTIVLLGRFQLFEFLACRKFRNLLCCYWRVYISLQTFYKTTESIHVQPDDTFWKSNT